jgi:hypothetical protein
MPAVTFVPLYFSIDASGFAYPYPATTSDIMQIGKVAASGVSGVAFDGGGSLISNIADPSSDTDATTKQWTLAQIQKYLTGLSWKTAVRAATTAVLADPYTYANGTLGVGATLTRTGFGAFPSVDTVTLTQGDRVLIKDETGGNAPYNGIYTLTTVGDGGHSWQLTRATDNDEKAEMNGATVTTDSEGTTNSDQAFIQTTYNPTMGSGNIVWVKGPSTVGATYTASHGVQIVTGDIRANPGDGLSAGATYLNVALDSNPGLALNGSSPTKLLAALPDTARGLDKDGSGLFIKLNGTTLALGASGASVNFAPDYQTTRTSSGSIAAGAAVYPSGVNVVSTGDSSNIAKCGIVGICRVGVATGQPVQLGQNGDIITALLVAATAGTPYYMGHAGTPIVAGSLVGSDRAILLGYAVNTTDLEVRIQDMGKKP